MLTMINIIRNVPKAHIAPQAHRFCRQANTSHHRFYKVSLPGDCHAALAMTLCFARKKKTNKKHRKIGALILY